MIAVDIQQEMLDLITKKAKKLKVDERRDGEGHRDRPEAARTASVDLILMVDVYHEFESSRSR